jgi:hypothetical protein
MYICDLFYQDGLGTNIGNLKKDYRFVSGSWYVENVKEELDVPVSTLY